MFRKKQNKMVVFLAKTGEDKEVLLSASGAKEWFLHQLSPLVKATEEDILFYMPDEWSSNRVFGNLKLQENADAVIDVIIQRLADDFHVKVKRPFRMQISTFPKESPFANLAFLYKAFELPVVKKAKPKNPYVVFRGSVLCHVCHDLASVRNAKKYWVPKEQFFSARKYREQKKSDLGSGWFRDQEMRDLLTSDAMMDQYFDNLQKEATEKGFMVCENCIHLFLEG